ncbi:hypothetical protein ABLT15_28185 [Paraburkholderia tropica]|uniref:hypothetical protein n=1 Tax=Paraburkholderia tropica TaxID=92647 RepID=UPI0032B44A8E
MTAILTLLASSGILKWLGIAAAGAIALLGAWLHGKSSGAKQAAQESAVAVADAQKQVAQVQASEAQANEAAQKAGSDAAAARTQIENEVAAQPPSEVRNELQNWTRN